jgi:hypothetical protein
LWFRDAKDGKWRDAPMNEKGQFYRYSIMGLDAIDATYLTHTEKYVNWANEALRESGLQAGELPGFGK